jgi:hypothetical protein
VQTRGNIADFLRHPDDETNLALELLLRNAYDALRLGDYDRANVIVESVERYLDPARATIDPLVSSFMEIVHTAVAFGYEPQRIAMDGDTAHVVATTASGYRLINLDLELRRGDWVLLAN